MSKGKLIFLGTGTSQGVPMIACDCEVCLSDDLRDKRLRSSVLVQVDGKNVVIDSGPDFRQQMLKVEIKQLDALVYTHEHKDHIAGMDDVRGFNFRTRRPVKIYCTPQVLEALKREYHYIFSENKYPGIPEIDVNLIGNNSFKIESLEITPIEVLHYKMPVLGYRIKDMAYITDANFIPVEEMKKLKGLKVLVLNALRREPHLSHFTLSEALELIKELNPEKAYLTHISHQLGFYKNVELELPANVHLAYDGLEVDF